MWLAILLCILISLFPSYIIFEEIRNRKPRFKESKEGHLLYWSPFYNDWTPFKVWNDKKENRVLKIMDLEIGYVGEGVSVLKWCPENLERVKEKFKTTKEIEKFQEEVINKEDLYMKKILKGKIYHDVIGND